VAKRLSYVCYTPRVIETAPFPSLAATALHRVTGDVDQQEAERGASEALQMVRQLAATEGPLNLVLDLRGVHFLTLPAHRAWSEGFARHSALQGLVRAVAIVGDDTPAFRGERELMETPRVRFFTHIGAAAEWLGHASADHR
jgi:hypothetical protein